MKQKLFQSCIVLFFIMLILYYKILDGVEMDKTFLTLSTFLFALLAGFFISRQSGRHGEIRKLTADFDGIMSANFRAMGHFGLDAQKKSGVIIKNHYQMIIKNGWDYPFKNKTTTLTDFHFLLEDVVKEKGVDGIKSSVLTRIMLGLHDAQKIRKNMVALREERIPTFQWLLIYMLNGILILTVSTIPSLNFLLGSIVKSAFITSIFVVIILLKQFDELKLFSGAVGEQSAQDVVNIIDGIK